MSLFPEMPLTPKHASAAIIVTESGYYLLQHRDAKNGIFYPDCWGFFGGGIESEEEPDAAIVRELTEELGHVFMNAVRVRSLGCFVFDFPGAGFDNINRYFFEIKVPDMLCESIVLGEGKAFSLISADDALRRIQMVPYDAFALWLHRYKEYFPMDRK